MHVGDACAVLPGFQAPGTWREGLAEDTVRGPRVPFCCFLGLWGHFSLDSLARGLVLTQCDFHSVGLQRVGDSESPAMASCLWGKRRMFGASAASEGACFPGVLTSPGTWRDGLACPYVCAFALVVFDASGRVQRAIVR